MDLPYNLDFALTFLPKGSEYRPTAIPLPTRTSSHDVVGISSSQHLHRNDTIILTDGLNDAGLSCGLLIAESVDPSSLIMWDPSGSEKQLFLFTACTHILASYGTVAEVITHFTPSNYILVVDGSASTALAHRVTHMPIHDPSGASAVIELTAGLLGNSASPPTDQFVVHRNPNGVTTNSPRIEEQLAILETYDPEGPSNRPAWINDDPLPAYMAQFQSGSDLTAAVAAFRATPGDLSSPSRFTRLSTYSKAAGTGPTMTAATNPIPGGAIVDAAGLYPATDAAAQLMTAHLILSHVMDVPRMNDRGTVQISPTDIDLTIYWTLKDHTARRYYFATMTYAAYRYVDVGTLAAAARRAGVKGPKTISLVPAGASVHEPFGKDATVTMEGAITGGADDADGHEGSIIEVMHMVIGDAGIRLGEAHPCEDEMTTVACASAIARCECNGITVACPVCGGGGGAESKKYRTFAERS